MPAANREEVASMDAAEAPSPVEDSRAQFGRLLSDALRRHDLTQQDFARIVEASQASVSGWVGGRYEPPPAKVFAMERLLGLEPGDLSRPLGYLPVEPGGTPSVETAITENTTLNDEEKGVLLAVHRALSRPAGSGRGRHGTTTGIATGNVQYVWRQ